MSDDVETPAAETEALAQFQADCRQLLLRAYDGRGLVPGDDDVIRIGGVLDTDAAVDIEAVGDTPADHAGRYHA